jgi:hypothetical protein
MVGVSGLWELAMEGIFLILQGLKISYVWPQRRDAVTIPAKRRR